MLKVAGILALATISVIAAMFASLLFFVHVISGNIPTAFLWLGAAMLAILFAVFVVVVGGASEGQPGSSAADDDEK
ncbi:hypothetical protein [Fuerstiella marisgermanici]|uniref:Uncharacterized protein n=1 Tax=Fuerstiella marisgermanici TaxID=1891926 RepID=A0A1P8WB38_9PLAN|nr:hypothetical protein [Fuerstiella marisgermanici]APZ91290.1 hypothetical protein Fuma_00878 [Fuerstiella marisgermanici]